jgi:hypothetical protein
MSTPPIWILPTSMARGSRRLVHLPPAAFVPAMRPRDSIVLGRSETDAGHGLHRLHEGPAAYTFGTFVRIRRRPRRPGAAEPDADRFRRAVFGFVGGHERHLAGYLPTSVTAATSFPSCP